MQNSTSEYLPTQDEPRHKKIFQLAPVEDDLTSIILGERIRVIENWELSIGARLMFVYLLDLSLRRTSNVRPGVLTISQMKLAEKFKVSKRTIWNWKRELEAREIIWMSIEPLPNAWPIDKYHISAIDQPNRFEAKTTSEGYWGNGGRRQPQHAEALGCREPGQKHLPVLSGTRLQRGAKQAKNAKTPDFSTASGKKLPLPAETGFHSPPKQVSTGSRNRFPLAAETDFHGEPKQIATGSRNRLPLAAETDCNLKKAKEAGTELLRGGKTAPPPQEKQEARKFPPFRSKVEKELNAIRTKIRWLRATAEHYQMTLSKDVADSVAWLRAEAAKVGGKKGAEHLADAERRESNPCNRVKGALLPDAANELARLRAVEKTLEADLAVAI